MHQVPALMNFILIIKTIKVNKNIVRVGINSINIKKYQVVIIVLYIIKNSGYDRESVGCYFPWDTWEGFSEENCN